MCILFLYLGNWAKQAASSQNFYKLILASNRDARFSQRFEPSTYWDGSDSHILAGKDLDENGTRLGISTKGKLGCLLKIKREKPVNDEEVLTQLLTKQGKHLSRATLVTQYLQSSTSGFEFCSQLVKGPEFKSKLKKYYPFHFFTVDLLAPEPNSLCATYISNYSSPDINSQFELIKKTPPLNDSTFFAYGNTPLYKPFQKVVCGRQEFIDIIGNHCGDGDVIPASPSNKEGLQLDLLKFLRSTKRYLPDPVLKQYTRASRVQYRIAEKLAARFVTDYFDSGTRVNTIILVDRDNNVTYHEWYLKHPIYNPETSEWIESVHEFTVKP